jgi:hypothetical protein
MCAFEENPSKKIKSEVPNRYMRCIREYGEYYWGVKVQEDFSWSFKGAL